MKTMLTLAAAILLALPASAIDEWMTITRADGATATIRVVGITADGIQYQTASTIERLRPSQLSLADRVRFGYATAAERAAHLAGMEAAIAAKQAREAQESAARADAVRQAELEAQQQTADELRRIRIEMERRELERQRLLYSK